jgi:hypothetical protein
MFNVMQKILQSRYKTKILDLCPVECDTTSYLYTISTSTYPTEDYAINLLKDARIRKHYANKSNSNVTIHQLKENIVMLTIDFKTLKYTFIDEIPKMSLGDLVINHITIRFNLVILSKLILIIFLDIKRRGYYGKISLIRIKINIIILKFILFIKGTFLGKVFAIL